MTPEIASGTAAACVSHVALDAFTASCDIEPAGCAFAWLLLFLSMVAHALHHCKTNECESEDDEPSTMYS